MSSWSVSLKSSLLILFISTIGVKAGALASEYSLDNQTQCVPYRVVNYSHKLKDAAYVRAWNFIYDRHALGFACYLTFASHEAYEMKYRFASGYMHNHIGSGSSVTLNIYASSSTKHWKKLASYNSSTHLPTSDQYISRLNSSAYLTLELQNYQSSTDFDFVLIVEKYDDHYISVGGIVGLTVGSVALVTIICVSIVIVRKRRSTLRGDLLSSTSGRMSPKPDYERVTATSTSSYPPQPSTSSGSN